MNKQNTIFNNSYNNLNTQQKQAVDAIEGPVMVNAGPGTGKTQILATRIGNILLQTDCLPNNILCLTYTDNGAVEMRNRLLKIIGTDAYGVHIHTFHSFCNEVIQDNIHYFGKLNIEPISDLEEIELFNSLIDGIDKNSILKRFSGDVYFEKGRLKNLFSLMKKEAFTPNYIIDKVDKYIQELPTKEGFYYKKKYKEFAAGSPKQAAIDTEVEAMEKLKAAVQLFATYNSLMSQMGRYNFDDMILWVLDAFENNNNLLLNYQEKYLYILVDEFQDTSRSQNLLLQHLISFWQQPNVFVVGDADQSIFSFQDANVENMLAFEKKYGEQLTKINLLQNYRSTQAILHTAHQVVINNQLRTVDIVSDAPLTAANTQLQSITAQPMIAEYANTLQEAMHIALQIEQLIQQGINAKEIAVIYRNHTQVEAVAHILEEKNIAVNTRKKVNVLEEPLVQNIVAILNWLDKESYMPFSADDILFKLLHTNWFNCKPIDIALLSIEANTAKVPLRKALAAIQSGQANLFSPPNNPLLLASKVLENLLQQVNNITVQQLLGNILQQTGILFWAMQTPEKAWHLQVLNAFFNMVKDSSKKQPYINLHQLVNSITLMQKNKLTIPLHKISATDNGVNLITAHGSKGSEFAHVFVMGCTTKIWDDTKSGNKNYKLPDNLISNNNTQNNIEESRRLFYVAITRAKTNLQVSYALKDADGKDLTKSSFVTEMATAMQVQQIQPIIEEAALAPLLQAQLVQIAKPAIDLVNEAYINELLKKYSLSVTHLSNYLNCPLKFYYTNLVKVPSPKNESMVFGSAVHFALERLFKNMKDNNNQFANEQFFLEQFTWYMNKNKEAFTPEAFVLKMEYGEKILPAYYKTHIQQWNKIVIAEHRIRNVAVNNIPLNGMIDKLEFNGKQVHVVDYKTGKYDNAKKKMQPPNDKEPNGGDYWRQAVFYKILVSNDKSNAWSNNSTSFEFIEPVNEEYKVATIEVSDEDVTTVTQQIQTVWQQIQNKQFNKGCGKPDCDWCNFVKNNQLHTALYNSEDDSLLEES
jgi:DNA helicase II / ATP-dependent DNA helicase PcrA